MYMHAVSMCDWTVQKSHKKFSNLGTFHYVIRKWGFSPLETLF
uniref:Uncharacterized protein n=1 Tax=Rhizophora mucronata TaxID=61149 RepID=A0A2P2NBZ3_RHIMU